MEPEARFERIETLLESLAGREAKSEARLSRTEARLSRMEVRLSRMEVHFQKRLDATLKLVQTGMRMLVEIGESQKRTDRKLQAFIDSLKKSGNGRRAS